MDTELVRLAIAGDGTAVVKHLKTDCIYYLKEIIKSKVGGEWKDSVIYYGRSGKFCRLIDDFEGFEYQFNDQKFGYSHI